MYMFFVPAKADAKVNARFNVKLVPEVTTDEAPEFSEHWLFCKVPATPGVSGPCKTPASFARYI